MSRFRLVRHLLASSGGGGGGGGAPGTSALIGINNYTPGYYNNSKAYANYLQYADAWEYLNSSGGWGPLPESYLVPSNGWPSSAPSLDAGGLYTFRKILAAAPTAPLTLNVTWVGNAAAISVGSSASGWTSTGANSGTFSNNLAMASDFNASFPIFSYSVTPGDPNPAHQFFISAPGVTLAEPAWVSDMNAMLAPGAPIRMLDPSAVNGNMGIWPDSGNGSTTFPSPTVTAANRNTPTGGNWGNTTVGDAWPGTIHGHDGWPIEIQFALTNAVSRPLWTCLQPNGSDDYFDLIATWIRDYETTIQPGQTTTQPWPTGRKIYLQMSNETWNSSFPYYNQSGLEAQSLGISSAQRVVQRSSQIFKRFETILGAAGKMNRIVRILDFRESGNPSDANALLTYNIGDGTTAASHHDMITAAFYFDASGSDPTNLTQAFSDLYADIDTVTLINVAYKAIADAHGLLYGCYEGGNGTGWPVGNTTQYTNFLADPRMEVAIGYALQSFATKVGTNVPMCWYADYGEITGGQTWGIKRYIGGPDTPSSTALKNHASGLKYLSPTLTGTFTVATDMTAGTVIGTLGRRTTGSTLVLSGNTNLAVDSATGNVTVVNTTGLVVGTPVSFTITESLSGSLNGPIATSLSAAVAGPEKVTNGSFSSSSGWTTFGNTIAGGVITCASAGQICQQAMDYVNGATYQLSLTYNQTDAATNWGELRVNLGAANGANVVVTSSTISGPGTLTLNFTAHVGAGNYLTIEAAAAGYTGTLDNISLRQTS